MTAETTETPARLATPREIAHYRRVSLQTLNNERYLGTGPKYKKLGGRVLYDWADVLAWVNANTRQRTDDQPAPAR